MTVKMAMSGGDDSTAPQDGDEYDASFEREAA
jgi:hypothetical protein